MEGRRGGAGAREQGREPSEAGRAVGRGAMGLGVMGEKGQGAITRPRWGTPTSVIGHPEWEVPGTTGSRCPGCLELKIGAALETWMPGH